jgi:para-nitrobenzyl esterase
LQLMMEGVIFMKGRIRGTAGIVLLLLLGLLFSSQSFALDDVVCSEPVSTRQGLIRGLEDPDYAACAWKGIPYAAPPVGDLRLRAPEPPDPHKGVYDAYDVGPSCPQEETLTSGGESKSFSEDCLYLNIWRPAKSGKFPVMLWIHGGSFVAGTGSYDMYDGAHLAAEKDVVVVTINYRLGALGFMALPELSEEDPDASTGNYGILDQIRALNWVQENIAGFGGDPDNVTIFGQSAGAMSVCTLVVSPGAAGLFHKAAAMSGPYHMIRTLEEAYESGKALSEKIGCAGPDVLECLREKPVEAFGQKSENDLLAMGITYSPCVDGYVLPDMPLTLIEQGRYHKGPMILSTTRDELRIYTLMIPGLGLWMRSTINALLRFLTGPNYDEIKSMYSYSDYRRPIDLAFAFGNEMTFDTPAFRIGEAMAGQNPVYLYRFDWNDTRFPHKMGAFHALDIPFVFGSMNIDSRIAKLLASKKTYEENEHLGLKMMSYFTNFAKTGDPNEEGLPQWPKYDTENRNRMHFDTTITIRPLTESEVRRYQYYAERSYKEVLAGVFKQ